uniref:VQ domain-containing protein n=1 Tax=Davidia involucrata TaxID=16924 RepID=A0A5B6ZWA9_DAVIN
MTSENLASLEPWIFRPTFPDSWISEAFARDTETLTKALQKSLSNHSEMIMSSSSSDAISPFFNLVNHETATAQTPTFSGSDAETGEAKRRNPIPVVANGKTTKRKTRASKRTKTTTTFITADPANFRQMVQQVTGVRFGHMPVAPVLKPEPQRPVNRLQGCLPTLDTSAFLLDQYQMGPTSVAMAAVEQSSHNVPPPAVVDDGGVGLDSDSFSNFPTLESWKVM